MKRLNSNEKIVKSLNFWINLTFISNIIDILTTIIRVFIFGAIELNPILHLFGGNIYLFLIFKFVIILYVLFRYMNSLNKIVIQSDEIEILDHYIVDLILFSLKSMSIMFLFAGVWNIGMMLLRT